MANRPEKVASTMDVVGWVLKYVEVKGRRHGMRAGQGGGYQHVRSLGGQLLRGSNQTRPPLPACHPSPPHPTV